MTGEERALVRECSEATLRHERFMREPGKLGPDYDLRRTSPAVITCPANPIALHDADYSVSCDWCRHQEGRHYCLLHGQPVKNMDAVACKDWADREKPVRAELERDVH